MSVVKKAKLEEMVSTYNHSDVWKEWVHAFSKDMRLNTNIACPSLMNHKDSETRRVISLYMSDIIPTLLKEDYVGGVIRYVTDESKIEKCLLTPLECFLLNSEAPTSDLKTYSKPIKFCGKVFAYGDLTYTCKDCSADPTCVFCHECFFNSKHVEHKYKLHASQGNGGYCDCGDEEAWSTYPACDTHIKAPTIEESDPLERFPDNLRHRATFLMSFLLEYCVNIICWTETSSLPDGFSVRTSEGNAYIVMLFNDESHTYDEVIDTLMEAVKCSNQQAFHFANIVDKKGRSAVFTGSLEQCEKVVASCMHMTSRSNKTPLKCVALYYDVLAHQVIALSIMQWLNGLVIESDVLRRLLSILVTRTLPHHDVPFLKQLMLVDVKLWKAARYRVHELCMNRVLLDTFGRLEVPKIFADCYDQVMRDFIGDDHEHSISIASLSVQMFTVPTIANILMCEHEMLLRCFKAFWNEVKPAVTIGGILDFQYNQKAVNVKRADYILNDVRYLLRHKPHWTPTLRLEFMKAFDQVLTLLVAMQGMDSCERKTKNHIRYEPNWEHGFNLLLWFVPIVELVISWCCSDITIYREVMTRSIAKLISLQELPVYSCHEEKESNEESVDRWKLIDYDVGKQKVSIHAALSRFIAGLIPGALRFPLGLEIVMPTDTDAILKILEPSVRAVVLMAQVNAQMWKRNGYAILHQIYYYQNVRFGSQMFDRDLLLFQTMASLMDPDHFLNVLIFKYKLNEWFSNPESTEDAENDGKSVYLTQEFFLLLYFMLGERYHLHVADVSSKEILQREVIHRLALGASSRSSLVKALPCKDPDDEELCSFEMQLDEVLKDVAEYRKPGVTGKGLYHLKSEMIAACNQYFYHYTKNERARMLEERKKLLKSRSELQAFTLKHPPEFSTQLSKCLSLLQCRKMIWLLKGVLSQGDKYEETIELAFLIIGIGLIEVKRGNPHVSNFLTMLQKPEGGVSLRSILEDMNKKSIKEYSGILKWVFQLMQSSFSLGNDDDMEIDDVDGRAQLDEKKRKKQLAAKRRAEMMAKMNSMQKAFVKTHQQFYDDGEADMTSSQVEEVRIEKHPCPVSIGVECTPVENTVMSVQCILCQEEDTIEVEKPMFVITCLQQKSSLLVSSRDVNSERDEVLPELNDCTRINVSSCGHIMHSECWEKHYSTVKQKEQPTIYQRRKSCIDVAKLEYLCPLCNSLCNTVLPLLPRNVEEVVANVQEMDLNEFMAYVKRFSVELGALPKKDKDIPPKIHRTTSFRAGLRRIIKSYIGPSENAPSNDNFMEMFAKKMIQVGFHNDTVAPGDDDRDKIPATHAIPLSWMSLSFTLQALEAGCRKNERNIFSELSERQMLFLYSFVQYLSTSCAVGVYESIADYGRQIFDLFCGDDDVDDFSIVDADIFGVTISLRFLVAAVGNVFQDKTPNFLKIPSCLVNGVVLKITFLAYLVKVLITAPVYYTEVNENCYTSMKSEESTESIVQSWCLVNELAGKSQDNVLIDGVKLKDHVISSLVPFLKCSTLFFHFLTGVHIPEDLKTNDVVSQFTCMLNYLNLPCELEKVLSLEYWKQTDSCISNIIKRWCGHNDVINHLQSSMICNAVTRELIVLPQRYRLLIKQVSGFKCPTVGEPSRSPALCLLCGTMICGQCYCCLSEMKNSSQTVGACSQHKRTCGKGVGLFLRVRECEVLMLYGQKKGCYMASPYLDEYGEPDRGFRRGNPLYLDTSRYDHLQQLWIEQKIPATIAHAMESNRNLLAHDWSST